jgi:hypothetical protein
VTYVTVAELRDRMGIGDSYDDDSLAAVLDVACAAVDNYCGRTFAQDPAVTVRTVRAADFYRLILEPGMDISTASGLIVRTDDNDDGTYETTWTIGTDFTLESSGYGYNGQSGWPWTQLMAVGAKYWPVFTTLRRGVEITARFGWPAVPDPVKQATLLLAAEQWKLKDAPLGVAAFGEFGPIRVRPNPAAAALLARYVHPITSALIA